MAAVAPARGTQSFLRVIGACWRRPSLLATELAWHWLAGIPALAIVLYQLWRIYAAAGPVLQPLLNLSPEAITADPEQAGALFGVASAAIRPALIHAAIGLGPAILFAWAVCSGFGRMAVLARYDPRLQRRPWTFAFFNLAASATLAVMIAVWFVALDWSAKFALGSGGTATNGVDGPTGAGGPNLILYAALVITISLGMFFLRSLVSWVWLAAPVVAVVESISGREAIALSLRRRSVRGKLVEVNLVMGIIKLALIVLATVFSAIPLPFSADMQGPPLWAWWAFVSVLYLAASDFFKMARVIAFVEFWREAPK